MDTEKISYRETESFLLGHNAGICFPRQCGNIIFVGNAGGLLDYMLGFGIYYSIISGVLAAESIYEGSSYEEKIRFLVKRVYQSYLSRLALNNFTNDDYDKLLGIIKLPYVNRAIYDTNIDVLELIGKSLKIARSKPELYDKF